MRPRFVSRLGVADAVTAVNAGLGFLATAAAAVDPGLAARLILLAGITDGLDGVVARAFGSSPVGTYLDSLADVASFGVAPAALVVAIAARSGTVSPGLTLSTAVALVVPALFVVTAVVRLAIYTAYDSGDATTSGVPTTLAATILSAATLAGIVTPTVAIVATALFVYLMIAPVTYPDLLARDALLMGIVHALAVVAPHLWGRTFPYALLTLGVAYLVFAPWLYWRDETPSLPWAVKGNA
ncbi:CDP-diacylglycerol--serine O-phosphatidyltransferase [Halobacteriales archaeon SW_7_68_16]|nr:MAG: CDP-diacylglycerol--serine O-phosphatidyltransferase [Halobacteriales archaeon SW_7_68_16]